MAFSKTIFVDNQTVIDADTLNAIQDELIRVGGLLGKDIQSAAIDNSGHLILTLTDGTTLDAGVAKGSDGVTPHIGDNGNWYLGSTDTGKPSRGATGAQGPKGATGPAGPQGPAGAPGKDGTAGADGVTPHIGDNGNWYLGTTDTGKPSRGATGANGSDGAQGEKGDTGGTGPQGPKGDTGDTGPQGPAGHTPVKGTDYWTAADKAEMVADVLAALPDGTEVNY